MIWLKQFWCAMRGHGGVRWADGKHVGTFGDPAQCKRCGKTWIERW